jgi:hypothetical protein
LGGFGLRFEFRKKVAGLGEGLGDKNTGHTGYKRKGKLAHITLK